MILEIRKDIIEPFEWKKFTEILDEIGEYVECRGYDFRYTLNSHNSANFIIFERIEYGNEEEIPYNFDEELEKCFGNVEIRAIQK